MMARRATLPFARAPPPLYDSVAFHLYHCILSAPMNDTAQIARTYPHDAAIPAYLALSGGAISYLRLYSAPSFPAILRDLVLLLLWKRETRA